MGLVHAEGGCASVLAHLQVLQVTGQCEFKLSEAVFVCPQQEPELFEATFKEHLGLSRYLRPFPKVWAPGTAG